jgi:hypothetical protein
VDSREVRQTLVRWANRTKPTDVHGPADFYLELLLRCTPFSYVRVESQATDPSFDHEDVEDPKYTAPDNDCSNRNEGVMSLPTM